MKLSTILSESIEEWTYEQFSVLLMIHAAHTDLEYSIDERSKILEFISEESLQTIERYYDQTTDGQILQIILANKSRFLQSSHNQNDMLRKLTLVFEADGEISKLEQTQYEFLHRLILDANF
ncbi:MAG: hypothetical protein ACJA01_003872 [Saprospiraceae bacterium]|jgi:hypothetical protein